MNPYRITRAAVLGGVMLALVASVATAASVSYSNKWRLQCSESAKSDGEVAFLFTPKGQEPFEVVIAVKKGMGENTIASKISGVLRSKLDKKAFSVEVDDGEDVLIKKKGSTPDFGLAVTRNTVKSFRIVPDAE